VFHGPVCNVISRALQGMWQLSLRHSDDGRPGPVVRKGIWGLFPLENQNNSTDLPCARMCLLAQPSPLLLLIDRVWALFRSLSIALQRVTRSASYKQTNNTSNQPSNTQKHPSNYLENHSNAMTTRRCFPKVSLANYGHKVRHYQHSSTARFFPKT